MATSRYTGWPSWYPVCGAAMNGILSRTHDRTGRDRRSKVDVTGWPAGEPNGPGDPAPCPLRARWGARARTISATHGQQRCEPTWVPARWSVYRDDLIRKRSADRLAALFYQGSGPTANF